MKGTIKVANVDGKKLIVACAVNDITIKDRKKIGADMSLIELSYKTPASLVDMGRLIDKVSGNELDEAPKEESPVKTTKK